MNKIMIMLKPRTNANNFVTNMKVSGFKFDSIIPMEEEGSVVVGFCDQATRAFIKALPNVVGIEDDHPVEVMIEVEDDKG